MGDRWGSGGLGFPAVWWAASVPGVHEVGPLRNTGGVPSGLGFDGTRAMLMVFTPDPGAR